MNLIVRILLKLEKMMNEGQISSVKKNMKMCGKNVMIDHTCHIIYPQKFSVGENSSISSYTTVYSTFGVTIGKNCLISSNCGISSYNHIINSPNRLADKDKDVNFSKPVVIEDNVWIGMNSCILPGVVIGNNSIIGSGSVVTKNVPPNEIWAGNPAKYIKNIVSSISNK